MGNFGDELTTVNSGMVGAIPGGFSVSAALLAVVNEPRPKFLYFHPRVYLIGPEGLPELRLPDGTNVRALIFPERHTLWFARAAVLRLQPGVAVILRGSLRADPVLLFDLPEVRARDERPTAADPTVRALVRIESTRVEEVYPEWFGARADDGSGFVGDAKGSSNAAAFQACLHAAVRDRTRDGKPLPPLTVISRGIFSLGDTIEALPDENGRGVLWMKGNGDASRRGGQTPSLNRFPRGFGSRARHPGGQEDDRSAALRLHPRVSAEVEGVGFKCGAFENGQRSPMDVAHALLIEAAERPDALTSPRWRHVFLDRCAFVGARDAVVAVRPRAEAAQPLMPAGDGLGASSVSRASVLRHATRYGLDACTIDAVLVPEIEESPPGIARLRARSARYAMSLTAKSGSVFTLNCSLVFQAKSAYFDSNGSPFSSVDLEAGLHIRGVSVLVRGGSFHLGEGPRPSRPAPKDGSHEDPDGQDFWLASNDDDPAPHLTVMHADSQSWWLLGADPIRRRRPGAVCLLNVGAGDVNLRDLEKRAEAGLPSLLANRFMRPVDSLEVQRLFTPPAVWWPESQIPLLLESCAFKRYVVHIGPILNVGTNFWTVTDNLRNTWMPAVVVPRPTPGDFLAGITAGRAIPEAYRNADQVPVRELPVLRQG